MTCNPNPNPIASNSRFTAVIIWRRKTSLERTWPRLLFCSDTFHSASCMFFCCHGRATLVFDVTRDERGRNRCAKYRRTANGFRWTASCRVPFLAFVFITFFQLLLCMQIHRPGLQRDRRNTQRTQVSGQHALLRWEVRARERLRLR